MSGLPHGSTDPARHSVAKIVLSCLGALLVAAAAVAAKQILDEERPRVTFGAKIKSYVIESDLLDRELPSRVVVPPRAASSDRPLLVFLHGRGENHRSYLEEPMFEALADLGKRAPVIVFPSAGPSSYWHDREGGQWGSYVRDEVVPEIVERFDIDPDRVAIGGISMGGFGAYDIARLSPNRFCAVGGHSPALWESASETADGAFDDADDFNRHDVIAAAGAEPSPYEDTRVWLDAGEGDPFLAGDEAFERALRSSGVTPIVRRSPGGHDSEYWSRMWPSYLGFYASALNRCEIGDEEKPENRKEPRRGQRQSAPEQPRS